MLGGVAVGLTAGIAGGVFCAARPDSVVAHGLHLVAMVGVCAPVYVVGLGTLLLFGSHIGRVADLGIPLTYTPFGDSPSRWLASMIVPWLVVGFPLAGAALRIMRAQTVEILGEDYLRTARAKGLSERDVFRHHAIRPAVAPVLSMAGATANVTLLNMVLVEHAFSVSGVFQHLNTAMDTGDFPFLFGLTIVGAVIVCAGNLAADLALMVVDPACGARLSGRELGERVGERRRDLVQRWLERAVGEQAEADRAVVAEHADREPLRRRVQRDDRVDALESARRQVERLLRARQVRDDEVERAHAAHRAGERARDQRRRPAATRRRAARRPARRPSP